MGFSLYLYVYKDKESVREELVDQNNSPIQLVNQIKGYFYVNPFIAISLAITLFSFVGVPPVIGFFAKQMILSAALDNGYVFMAIVAILTSVIGAAYFLNLIKQIFFFNSDYKINPSLHSNDVEQGYFRDSFASSSHLVGYVSPHGEGKATTQSGKKILFKPENITLNSSLSSSISILTLLLILFIYVPAQ